jgi:hypothetical protein
LSTSDTEGSSRRIRVRVRFLALNPPTAAVPTGETDGIATATVPARDRQPGPTRLETGATEVGESADSRLKAARVLSDYVRLAPAG